MSQEFKLSASAIVEQDKHILLVADRLYGEEVFSLPGGTPRRREDLTVCVMRETAEETGLDITPEAITGIYHLPRSIHKNNILRFVYLGTTVSGEVSTSNRHPVVDFFSKSQIKEMAKAGRIKPNCTLQAIHDYRQGQRLPLDIVRLVKPPKRSKYRPRLRVFPNLTGSGQLTDSEEVYRDWN